MKNKIFISHATPDDNDFTRWLALKLIGLGYDVWCDIFELEKGVDFWKAIEHEIRNNSCRFLLILSSTSNQRDGVLKELAVALKVKKTLNDESFIIPLNIDTKLSYDDINIEVVRLNAIDFRASWAQGLQELLKSLHKYNTPKNVQDFSRSLTLYNQIFLQNRQEIEKEEIYDSNWFPILEFPKELRFHNFKGLLPKDFDVRKLTFPAVTYKEYLCTFAWEYDFMHHLPKTETYNSNKTIRIPIASIFDKTYDSDFIPIYECQRVMIQLINKAFINQLKNRNLREYNMSNKTGFWIEKGQLDKDKFNKTQMVGIQKGKFWHFGISGVTLFYPHPIIMISSHIYFTEDGTKLIEKNSIQHSARRRQGKNWWNNDWKTKLLAFVKYVSDQEDSFSLEVGSEEKIIVGNTPVQFKGNVSYNLPQKNNLAEETEIYDYSDDIDTSEE